MMRLLACLAICAGLAVPARADVTIGLFAPSAPFEGSADRVTFANAVAEHLTSAARGTKVTGKVYGSASAFASAVKKGEIQFAIIGAPYATANGLPYNVLAAATRGGEASAPWQLIANASIGSVRDLRAKKVALPIVGARAQAFVTNVLLGGEVDAGYFASITEAADARSAVTMVTVGKVDAAFVPAGVEAPAGTKRIATLTTVGWPMFVALPGADAKLAAAFGTRIQSFGGAAGFGAFTDAGAGQYKGLVGAFAKTAKRGPMALPPPARFSAKELLSARAFTAPLSNPLDVVAAPPPP